MSQVYCKQCNFYIERHAVVKPPPLGVQIGKPAEMTTGPGTEGSSITERWKEIKAAAGIVDDFDWVDVRFIKMDVSFYEAR